jgi:hypothetical protein
LHLHALQNKNIWKNRMIYISLGHFGTQNNSLICESFSLFTLLFNFPIYKITIVIYDSQRVIKSRRFYEEYKKKCEWEYSLWDMMDMKREEKNITLKRICFVSGIFSTFFNNDIITTHTVVSRKSDGWTHGYRRKIMKIYERCSWSWLHRLGGSSFQWFPGNNESALIWWNVHQYSKVTPSIL